MNEAVVVGEAIEKAIKILEDYFIGTLDRVGHLDTLSPEWHALEQLQITLYQVIFSAARLQRGDYVKKE